MSPKRLTLLALVLAAVPVTLLPAAPPADPLTLNEVVSLLEAGVGETVILKQMKAGRTRLIMTVDALLKLKAAGASDAFMEAILDTAEPAETEASPGPSVERAASTYEPAPEGAPNFRIYTMADPNGAEVIHITNLDENGVRIGGELKDPSRPNVLAPSQEPPPAYDYATRPEEDPPVIVNVYPPAAPQETYREDPRYGLHSGELYPVGVFPGYYPYNPGFTPRIRTGHGYRGSYPNVYHYSPPGSYSHYINNHRPGGSHAFRRYHSVNPYRRATAHQRNQVIFNRARPRPTHRH